ncbi:BLUF domain-containing protein [Poseidonibacter lekithochrous]|uniref:BLUF domain-containing protein n=1 Tax=Poseidonibacter lekithochrous TaxID=1904463 RepID=UPI000D38CB41|nr:BLUF domain-containing protein [Poseidonibacter lekithochrous]
MYRIMYLSNATVRFTDKELEDLLAIARERNGLVNVTGLLIIKGRTFLQCLEGPKESVNEIFEKIKKDVRHDSIVELIEEDEGQRYFPDWSMGYKNINHLDSFTSQKLKDYSAKENFKSFSTDDISEIFKEFIEVT